MCKICAEIHPKTLPRGGNFTYLATDSDVLSISFYHPKRVRCTISRLWSLLVWWFRILTLCARHHSQMLKLLEPVNFGEFPGWLGGTRNTPPFLRKTHHPNFEACGGPSQSNQTRSNSIFGRLAWEKNGVVTPWKINMEHNHGGLEDNFPF